MPVVVRALHERVYVLQFCCAVQKSTEVTWAILKVGVRAYDGVDHPQ